MCVHPVVLHHFLLNQTDPNICFENGYRWRLLHVIICSFNQLKTNYLLSVKLTLVWDFAFSVAFSAILQSKIHIFFLFLALFNIFYLCIRVFIQNMPNKICEKKIKRSLSLFWLQFCKQLIFD